jgi:hypothetical protein
MFEVKIRLLNMQPSRKLSGWKMLAIREKMGTDFFNLHVFDTFCQYYISNTLNLNLPYFSDLKNIFMKSSWV